MADVERPILMHATLSDSVYEQVELLARQSGVNLNTCPGCRARRDCPTNSSCSREGGSVLCFSCGGCGTCKEQSALVPHYLRAGIGKRWWRLDWPAIEFPSKPIVDQYIESLAANLRDGRGLTFLGPTGTGKSTAAVHVLKQAVRALGGNRVLMVRFDRLVSSYDDAAELDRYRGVRLLLVDELLAPASAAQGGLYDRMLTEVLGERYDRLNSTLITSNLQPDEFASHYPRVASRQRETNQPVAMDGKDRRGGDALFRSEGPIT